LTDTGGRAYCPAAVTTKTSAIILDHPAGGGKPRVRYRYAGDQALQIEYGEMEFDLTLNFLVLAVDDVLRRSTPDGLIETAPGFRTILLTYDPAAISASDLVDHVQSVHGALPDQRKMSVPSKVVHMPVAFDDSTSRQAVQRYINTIRADAPNAEGGTNIDYIVRYNGLADRDALYESILQTEMWTAFIGFFPGLPFMFPLDPRDVVFVPKYNPTRTWTAEGALGIGGPCYAIYPVESAGGYQLVGRTLPIYDLQERNEIFCRDPLLLAAGDRVKFHLVSEEELLQSWEDVRADRYRYRVEDGVFDVGAYLEWLPSVAAEAEEHRRRRDAAAEATPVP
jgi:urea carboxylase